jgi:hypothetical protein
MYNFLVSGWEEEWQGAPCTFDLSRCVKQHEYTDKQIAERYGSLDQAALAELTRLPCIFAYEAGRRLDPKFGLIREVTVRRGQARIEYELIPVQPFLMAADFSNLEFELDIGNWEMNRTHWAVKDVNLPRELHVARGIALPSWTRQATRAVDITQHNFDVGLSFPGEARGLVEQVARELEARIGPNAYFYDNNYVSQLARPSLDTLLQEIYRSRCKLIVVFLGADYQRKDCAASSSARSARSSWCVTISASCSCASTTALLTACSAPTATSTRGVSVLPRSPSLSQSASPSSPKCEPARPT